ncbi:MAG TPA: DUF433 domain-containing protein [Ignavibacteria bacterium]|nr:DUF433 domain-containing protein [Ignavibacteria bacterium]HRF64766.1 DUF433 domain-containing protein [Ignavibacteria bacterium]HRJ05577.1 DUF433 domain-containing protein [Ignavibacteria bacterium]
MNFKSINIVPEIMGGTPVFTGTRVPIQTLFDYFEGGDSLQQFLDDFPTVEKEKALEVLHIAEKLISKSELLNENIAG